jgi:CO/xanthine dehydrogenase Mo-binding subunit
MGDTKLPEAGPTYGSSSTMGVGAAVLAAAQEVRGKLARLANLPPAEATMVDGRIARSGAREGWLYPMPRPPSNTPPAPSPSIANTISRRSAHSAIAWTTSTRVGGSHDQKR